MDQGLKFNQSFGIAVAILALPAVTLYHVYKVSSVLKEILALITTFIVTYFGTSSLISFFNINSWPLPWISAGHTFSLGVIALFILGYLLIVTERTRCLICNHPLGG